MAQHQPLAAAVGADEVERPDLARSTAREPAQILDHDALARLARDVSGQSLGELARGDGASAQATLRSRA
jgi:hypothetical protein